MSGYAPEEVESQISRPIEEALATTQGLAELESRSRAGVSDVVLEFRWGTDMDRATQDIRERLQIAPQDDHHHADAGDDGAQGLAPRDGFLKQDPGEQNGHGGLGHGDHPGIDGRRILKRHIYRGVAEDDEGDGELQE